MLKKKHSRWLWIWAAAIAISGFAHPTAVAQLRSGRTIPNDDYYSGFRLFYSGDYRTAFRVFRSAARGGVKTPDRRWVDAICYETMMGECYYHQGDLRSALNSYDNALNIFLANKNWLKRLKYPANIQPKQARVVNWGKSNRKTILGNFPSTLLSEQAILNLTKINNQDAFVQQKEMYKINGIEIFRCTALALSRRYELLGPLCPHDPLSSKIERRLAQRSVAPGHWAQKLFDVQLGIAKLGAGYEDDALRLLNGALTVGQLDHPLTSRALLEIGRIALRRDQLDLAMRSFFEASFPAAQFELLDEVEEALLMANRVHRLTGAQEPFVALQHASVWARTKRFERLHSALLIAMAENAVLKGQSKEVRGIQQLARRAMGRSDLARGDLGARLNYVSAILSYQSKKRTAGNASWDAVMKYQQRGSKQLFRIDSVYQSASGRDAILSPRVANGLFANVLRVPNARDWRLDPMEALTVQSTDHQEKLAFWMQIALERKEIDRVVQIADRIRRQKFFATLPKNGRVMSLRWTLHGPTAWLDEQTTIQRQNLMRRFPEYAELTKEADRYMAQLARMDPIPDEGDAQTKWKDVARKLDDVSKKQEDLLFEIALHPEPAEVDFPPLRTIDQIEAGLRPGQAVLDMVSTKSQTHFILISAAKDYETWSVNNPARVRSSIVEMLRSFGNYSKDKPITAANLANDQWKKSSLKMYTMLFPQKGPSFWSSVDELIVVPDGAYWYLPFEAMNTGNAPLISKTKVRYVPTASLAINDSRQKPVNPATVIVRGRLYNNRKMDEVISESAATIAALSPRSKVHSKFLPVGSAIIGHRWDRLVVLDDIEGVDGEAYAWGPAQADGKSPGSKLFEWMELPFGAPDQMILPGFHTAAESGGKGRTTGDELLRTSLGLLSTGSRTVLISRWRTGGQTSLDLVREFVSQLPQGTAAASLQRGVQLTRSEVIDPLKEPRVKGISDDNLPKGEHPFFWAGMQLIDLGQPQKQ